MILLGQNVTTGPPMYVCIQRALSGDAKAELLHPDKLVESCTVASSTTVMNMLYAEVGASTLTIAFLVYC